MDLSNPAKWNFILHRYCIWYDYTIEAKLRVRLVLETLVHTYGNRFRFTALAEDLFKWLEFFNIRLRHRRIIVRALKRSGSIAWQVNNMTQSKSYVAGTKKLLSDDWLLKKTKCNISSFWLVLGCLQLCYVRVYISTVKIHTYKWDKSAMFDLWTSVWRPHKKYYAVLRTG